MNKKFKGFTLIELIVVMAILVILMAAIMNMFKPIRETYVDATLYESQRTAQNGVVQYIAESVRYSHSLGLYTKSEVSSVVGAAEAFTAAYLKANDIQTTDPDYTTKYNNTLSEVKKKAEVIIIDNTKDAYAFGDDNYTGRILRRKFKVDASGNVQELTTNAEVVNTAECRLALGAAYYGESDYTITFGVTQDASLVGTPTDGIKITVASNATHGIRENAVISNTGLVVCKNQDPNSGVNGMFDTTKFKSATSSGDNTKVYIVFINDKITIA